MSAVCTRCGSPAAPGTPACAVCGGAVQQAAWNQSAAAAPQQAYGQAHHGQAGQQQQASGWGQASGQQGHQAQGAWGQAPGGQAYPGGQAPRPHGAPGPYGAPNKDNSSVKIGIGVAGCVSILVVIVIGLAALLGSAKSSSSSDDDDARASSPGKTVSPPQSGSLRSRVPRRVGEWRIQKVSPVADTGNIDGVTLEYRKLGRSMHVVVFVFSSTSQASTWVDVVKDKTSKNYRKNNITPRPRSITITRYNNKSARTKGYRFEHAPETLVYHVEKTGTMIAGNKGDVVEFFKRFAM